MFRCEAGLCTEMLDYSCERSCTDIGCDKSLIILNGDNILLGDCQTASHRDTGERVWSSDGVHTLLANCLTVNPDPDDPTNTSYIGTNKLLFIYLLKFSLYKINRGLK